MNILTEALTALKQTRLAYFRGDPQVGNSKYQAPRTMTTTEVKTVGTQILDCIVCGDSVHKVYSDGKAGCMVCNTTRFVPEVAVEKKEEIDPLIVVLIVEAPKEHRTRILESLDNWKHSTEGAYLAKVRVEETGKVSAD